MLVAEYEGICNVSAKPKYSSDQNKKSRNTVMAVESCGDFHALPEDCIAKALSLTSPKEACRFSLVASAFLSVSRSDTVWDRFLPSDYLDIISRAVDGPNSFLSKFQYKMDLYLHLCDNPILIDGGKKSFSLEKWSGKKCFMLAARDLSIVWGDTPKYWQWISSPGSRFHEVAELLWVCWFEVRGKISTKMLSPGTNYAAYLVFTWKSTMYGFGHQPAEAHVSISGQESEKRTICLDPKGDQIVQENNVDMDQNNTVFAVQRDDGWMEVELGEYFVKGGGQEGELEVSLMEVNCGDWKSGLVIQGIEIRPKECK